MEERQRHEEAVRSRRAVPRWPAVVALQILAVLVSRVVNTLAAHAN